MLHIYGADPETGQQNDEAIPTDQPPRGRQLGDALDLPLRLPRNRSTGNLALPADTPDKARLRLSFDAGAAAAEFDSVTRSPIMTDHDHGMGRSGLRRIRQHTPMYPRGATSNMNMNTLHMPSDPSSRRASAVLPRSVSMTLIPNAQTFPLASAPTSPAFIEDLTRFPSESLHSFSFAHQSDDLLHNNRQSSLKRSADFMRERLSRSVSRTSQDTAGPLSAESAAGDNVFDRHFIPRTLSPEPMITTAPSSQYNSPVLTKHPNPPETLPQAHFDLNSSSNGNSEMPSESPHPAVAPDSADSSRTPTNESSTTQHTSPPESRRQSLLLKRAVSDNSYMSRETQMTSLSQKLSGAGAGNANTNANANAAGPSSPSLLATSPSASQPSVSVASPLSMPANLASPTLQPHATRWVPAAQAIFTTEAKPPWTIIAANDLACLVFGVTRAEVRKMGIMEVIQEERRSWLEKRLMMHGDPDEADDEEAPATTEIIQPAPKPATRTSSLLGSRSGGLGGGGITAKLLSKPNSRTQTLQSAHNSPRQPSSPTMHAHTQVQRASTVHGGGSGSSTRSPKLLGGGHHHYGTKSRGVLLCGDVVPIQKRNGALGSASLWVKEKRIGLIWVLEEIHEDMATATVDDTGIVTALSGSLGPIWGDETLTPGMDVAKLVPKLPRLGQGGAGEAVDFHEVAKRRYYTCRNSDRVNIPATVDVLRSNGSSASPSPSPSLRISSFPHIAGIVVVSTQTLTIKSSNSVFSGALFGYEKPNGLSINQLVPQFDQILQVLIEVDNVHMADGIVVPEHSFRKAAAFLSLREGRADATAAAFLRPEGLTARHRDGGELRIDVQMRVVTSERQAKVHENTVLEAEEEDDEKENQDAASAYSIGTADSTSSSISNYTVTQTEMVYALWITYSRHLHATRNNLGIASPLLSGAATPLHQPSPGQTPVHSPPEAVTGGPGPDKDKAEAAQALTQQLDAAMHLESKTTSAGEPPVVTVTESKEEAEKEDGKAEEKAEEKKAETEKEKTEAEHKAGEVKEPKTGTLSNVASSSNALPDAGEPDRKTTIADFLVLEDMGQGAYGQVKLAKHKATGKVLVIKYVTKRRILVDTWTRDRRLGTVPLEIHVLDYLRRNNLRHRNIVDMEGFFEDDINYYIEMIPTGLPGMDLFDYIELRSNMEEEECRSIFVQVAEALRHLHTKALVVHRDIKDENIILDGEGNIKLIDFGSAAYLRSAPFDVFVGTIDYAAPEVLAGRPYNGKEQDVWALGILLYTIIYKENPFYSIDEIMDRDLRIPYIVSEDSIDLIRRMLNRDVEARYTIEQVLDHPWCTID